MPRKYRFSETADVTETYITPTDVKQYVFCPRVTYFTRVMKIKPILGSQQEAGKKSHEHLSILETRRKRTLKTELPFVVKSKEYEKVLVSERLGVSGKLDMLITTNQNEFIPVEFKMMFSNKGKVLLDHKYQLLLLGLLVEETYGQVVQRGVVHYMNNSDTILVRFSHSLKSRTEKIVSNIQEMISLGSIPNPRRECTSNPIGCGFADQCGSW
jgi:CRISPR-associated exonuclease Cas4